MPYFSVFFSPSAQASSIRLAATDHRKLEHHRLRMNRLLHLSETCCRCLKETGSQYPSPCFLDKDALTSDSGKLYSSAGDIIYHDVALLAQIDRFCIEPHLSVMSSAFKKQTCKTPKLAFGSSHLS